MPKPTPLTDTSHASGVGGQGDGAAPAGAPEADVPPGAAPEASGGPSLGGRLARWAVGGLVGLAVFIGGALLLLQTEAARARIQAIAVQQIANLLADDATVRVERLDGDFLTGARLIGLEVERDGETVVTVDTVLVDYDLTTLLRRRFSASQLVVAGPSVFVRQRPDSTFNVSGLLKPTEDDSTKAPFVVDIDALALRRGAAEVRWLNADRDSILAVRDLELFASGFHSSEDSLTAAIDALSLVALAPEAASGAGPAATMRVAAEGAFSRERLALSALSVESDAGTDLSGTARLRLPQEGDAFALPVFEADLVAEPLALADARAFSGVRVFGKPRVRITADSDGERVDFTVRGALDPEQGRAAQPASVALDGQVEIEPNGGALAVRLDGEIRRFDPAVLLGNPDLAATLNGTISADVRGRSPEALTGPVEILLTDSRVGARGIDRLRVDADFRTGAVDFTADAAMPGLAGRASGFARPFDSVPALEATGTLEQLDLAALTGDPSRDVRLRGDFAIEGRGASLQTLVGSAAITLDEAVFPVGDRTLRLSAADLDATLRGGSLTFDADVALPDGGQIAAVGTAEIDQAPIPYRISQGRFANLDLATLTGDPAQASDLNGSFTLDGRGLDPRLATLAATLDLAPSTLPVNNGLRVASGRADARLSGGRLTFDAAADLGDAGSLTAAGTARPFAQPLAYEASGTFSRLNIAALTGDETQESDLSGAFTASGSGIDLATLTTSGTLRLSEPGYIGDRNIDSADLAFSLARGDLSLRGDLAIPGLSLAGIDITGRPFDGTPTFALGESTCFSDLDVSALADVSIQTSLNGCFRGSITGLDPATATGSGVVTLRPSRINQARVLGGDISFSLVDDELTAQADLDFEPNLEAQTLASGEDGGTPEASRLVAVFNGRLFDEEPTYTLTGRTEALDINALLPDAPTRPLVLTADFDLDGRGLDPLESTITGEVVAEPSRVGFLRLDELDIDFALDAGTLRLDTLVLRSDLADLTGGGQIAVFDTTLATSFRLRGEARDLASLSDYADRPLAAERISLDLAITGDAGEPLDIDGTVEARTFAISDILLTGLDATLDATVDPQTVLDGTGIDVRLDTEFDLLQLPALGRAPAIQIRSGDFALGYDGEDIRLSGDVTIDDDRDLSFSTRLELDAEPDIAEGGIGFELERLDLRLGETGWLLAQPGRIVVAPGDVILFERILLQGARGPQQIAADGLLDFDGEQDLILTAEDVNIGTVTDLIGLGDLGGILSTDLALSGPAASPVISGSVDIENLTSRGELFGAMDATVGYARGRITLDAVLTHRDGEALFIEGYIPRNLSFNGEGVKTREGTGLQGVQLEFTSEAFPIAWAQPFLASRGYTDLGGTLEADVTVAGTRMEPRLSGNAVLRDGRLGVRATNMTYEPLYAELGFEGDQILLEDVRITNPASGETDLTVTGDITLEELAVGALDLTIQPDGFVAIDTRTYDRLVLDRGSRPLRLTGTLQRPVLRGAVVLARGDIYLTEEIGAPDLEPVELTAEQIRTVEARFGRRISRRDTAVSRFTDALDYDLAVEIRRNVWLRSEGTVPFDIEFSGDVTATKAPFAEGTSLSGTIDLIRGDVETLGKRFDLERGRLVFNGPPLTARVDLLATLEARFKQGSARTPIEINLRVNGQLDQNPEIRLSSPQLSDPADIVSVIATGQLASDLFGTNALTNTAQNLVASQATGFVEGLGESIGLDLIEIDTDGSDLVVRGGLYLSEALFFSLGYVVVPNPTDRDATEDTRIVALLDYELKSWLLLQGERSAERGYGGGLRFEFA